MSSFKNTCRIDTDIDCANHEVCGGYQDPRCGKVCCYNCLIMFDHSRNGKGELNIRDNIECPICLDTKRGITYPRCDHYVCIECFKYCMYGPERIGEPEFPYPDIEDEYDEDPENPKWKDEYPLIEKYNMDWDEWDDKYEEDYANNENLRNCPLCRA